MHDFTVSPGDRELLALALSMVGMCIALLTVSWPYVGRDKLDQRMRRVANERESIRARERARTTVADPVTAVRRRPRKLFSDIVTGLGLSKAVDPKLTRMLQNAGYRGTAAVVTYLAARVITPFLLLALALFYVFAVFELQQPLAIKLLIVAGAAAAGYFLPALYVRNAGTKRQQSIERAWPDALDLLLICVESGMGIEQAMKKVSEEIGARSVSLAEELALTTAELSYLPVRKQAYENFADRTGLESVKAVATTLKQAEKHGTSLGRSLRVLAQENRTMRMTMAEKKAAALPPMLTVPMILFFLPVLFVVIITPAAIQISSM